MGTAKTWWNKNMSMEYIRHNYGVPAKRGGRIEFTDSGGVKWRGIIRAARGAYLSVSLDGFVNKVSILHPTWNVEYLPPANPAGVERETMDEVNSPGAGK